MPKILTARNIMIFRNSKGLLYISLISQTEQTGVIGLVQAIKKFAKLEQEMVSLVSEQTSLQGFCAVLS